ncbi:acyltransferase family protein, partial [Galbibacter sp. EGI 63066]|uniref:acyltransferase family protein n=1 Tax=Galbibacter sp. EGI 63066 TaxID=2993559 RepID=UPI002248FEFD
LLLVRHYPHPERVPLLGELARPRWLVAMTGLVVLLPLPGWLEYSSKETWTIPLFILFTLWAMSRLHGRPATPLVRRINEYSFGIYLAHPLFFGVVDFLDQRLAFPLPLYALLLVTAGLAGSVGLNVLVNRLSWGGLMFGKRLRVA